MKAPVKSIDDLIRKALEQGKITSEMFKLDEKFWVFDLTGWNRVTHPENRARLIKDDKKNKWLLQFQLGYDDAFVCEISNKLKFDLDTIAMQAHEKMRRDEAEKNLAAGTKILNDCFGFGETTEKGDEV